MEARLAGPQDLAVEIKDMLGKNLSQERIALLGPLAELAVDAHQGHLGLDGRPLALHCADVALSPWLETTEQQQLGLLHDAATPGYSNFTQEEFAVHARAAGCSARIINAALCFARPPVGWHYDDWISFLMRDDLTRLVKIADSEAAISHFPPANGNQLAAWQRTLKRLTDNQPEPPEVTARIEVSLRAHHLPDLRTMH